MERKAVALLIIVGMFGAFYGCASAAQKSQASPLSISNSTWTGSFYKFGRKAQPETDMILSFKGKEVTVVVPPCYYYSKGVKYARKFSITNNGEITFPSKSSSYSMVFWLKNPTTLVGRRGDYTSGREWVLHKKE